MSSKSSPSLIKRFSGRAGKVRLTEALRTQELVAGDQQIATKLAAGKTVTNTLAVNLPVSAALLYDANGNLTNDGLKSLSYDAENQLTNVMVAGQWREDFLYDALNRRRITRQYAWQGSAWVLTNEIRLIYDGNNVIQEWNASNVAQVTYTRGVGGLLARTDATGTAYYHADGNHNITALINNSQTVVARYLYDPFGRSLGQWGGRAAANVYRFAGKEWDAQAGFYYFGRRYYDPNLQRWLNHDPIGERGGINLYRYAGNSPVNYLDPYGLNFVTTSWTVAGAGIGGLLGLIAGGGGGAIAGLGVGDAVTIPAGAIAGAGAGGALGAGIGNQIGNAISDALGLGGENSAGQTVCKKGDGDRGHEPGENDIIKKVAKDKGVDPYDFGDYVEDSKEVDGMSPDTNYNWNELKKLPDSMKNGDAPGLSQ